MVGGACLDRVMRPAGGLDLCWTVVQESDADPVKDYTTSACGGRSGGASAAALVGRSCARAGPVNPWTGRSMRGRVASTTGPADATVAIGPDNQRRSPAAGGRSRTSTAPTGRSASSGTAWCLLPRQLASSRDRRDGRRGAGTVPAWDIYGDIGD